MYATKKRMADAVELITCLINDGTAVGARKKTPAARVSACGQVSK
jgi:hypothetical protein